jgi:aconitate hydratase
LKKQGVLPLTFCDPADYDKAKESDRVSIRGLEQLKPGGRLTAVLHHGDGSQDSFEVKQTLNDEQIAWFKAGSALNLLREQA